MSDTAGLSTQSSGICPECGSALPARAPLGLCPRCLVGAVLAARADLAREPEPESPETDQTVPHHKRHSRFGDYELLDEIARGGMGQVYRARQISLNRIVAVKFLLFGKFASDEFIQRFRAEARLAAGLQHPNIVSIHEVGEDEGQQFFSMDYVEGQNLADIVRNGPLPPQRAATYLRTICQAIQYSHDQGILHGDLKPSNVLIDRFDQPRITDFGLARDLTVHTESSSDATVLGSPGYISPEQADPHRGPHGIPSDVYSLGAILYHLLTGRVPFAAGTARETIDQVLTTDPAPLRLLNPSVPRDLETICLKCLQKRAPHRYPSAAALADDLGRWLRGEPISARPSSHVERLWRWCRREPAVASLSALAALILVTGTLLVTWQWRRAEINAALYRNSAYADGMKAAFAEYEEGNLGQVARLLDEQKPRRGEPDLRGFEWYYLQQLTHPRDFLMLPRLPQVAGNLSFSPNSRYLSTFTWDDTLRLWDLQQPSNPLLTLNRSSGPGAFTSNGEVFIAGDRDGSVRFYSVPSGTVARTIRVEGEMICASANGSRLVTMTSDGRLNVLDAQTAKPLFTSSQKVPRRSDYGWVPLVAISADGRLLAWVLPAQSHKSPDRLAIWDVDTGKHLANVNHPHVRTLLFSPDATQLAVAGGETTVLVAAPFTGEPRPLPGTGLPTFALSFSADGKTLATGGSDESIQLWDVATAKARPGALRAQLGDVMSLAFSPDAKWLATGGRDSEVRLLPIGDTPAGFAQDGLNSEEWGNFSFSPNSTLMAAALKGDVIKVWNVQDQSEVATFQGARFVVGFSRDNQELLLADPSEHPFWWNLRTGNKRTIPAYPGSAMSAADLSPDRQLAVIGHQSGELELLELDSGRRLAAWQGHPERVKSLAFSPNGKFFVSGSSDRAVSLWNIADLKKIGSSSEHRGAVCALAVSEDGRLIASACGADTIKFWDASDLNHSLTPSMSFHKAQINALAFSPEGKTLASGSDDQTVRLWHVATHQEMASLRVPGPIQVVRFSPNGKHLAVVTRTGQLRLLSIP